MKNNDEILRKQNEYKLDIKDVLSEKYSFYYQVNIDFNREKQSQYYLGKINSVQKGMSIKWKTNPSLGKCIKVTRQAMQILLKKKIKCISTSTHIFGWAIWDKLPECIFENFEITRVKRGQFQNFQKSQG